MSNVTKTNGKSKIFETVLSSPGMTEKCKIVLQTSRQNVLVLGRLIEYALLTKEQVIDDEIIAANAKESQEEFKEIHAELLSKSGLTDFYQRIKEI
jgi:hypothetical protein